MADDLKHLSGAELMATVRALADDIGPRPAGHSAEEKARDYLRQQLAEIDIANPETLPFMTWDTWGWNLIPGLVLALAANLLGRKSGLMRLLATLVSAFAAKEVYDGVTSRKQNFEPLYPKRESGTVVARLKPAGEVKRKVVLIGHTDSNKHRASFSETAKKRMMPSGTLLFAALVSNIITLGVRLVGNPTWARRLQVAVAAILSYALFTFLRDETDDFVDGANDNASAVACVLGLGRQVHDIPLKHTEVWLAFTGAEEVGLLGTRALLDQYGDTLRDAYFIDFELVGAGQIAYVTHHSGFALGTGYTPDPYSACLAAQVVADHPEWGVTGRPVVINEEVRALRQRDFRGICLVGLDEQGWLSNWHRYSDNTSHIDPHSLETAARFAWAMLGQIDAEADR